MHSDEGLLVYQCEDWSNLIVFIDLVLDDEHVPGLLQLLDGLSMSGLKFP